MDQGYDDTKDSDVDPATAQVTVSLFSDVTGVDMGVYTLGDLGGRVWCDANHNSAYDPGEAIVGGVVDLRSDPECDGVPNDGLASSLSDADGVYRFTGFLVGLSDASMPECYVLLGGDLACQWPCCVPITPQQYAVELDTAKPNSLHNNFGFKPVLHRVYLPIVLR
jgi:hypothetical protein